MPFYGKTNERMYVIEVWGRGVKGRVVKGQRRIELSNNFHSETAWSPMKGTAKNLAGRPARDRLQSGGLRAAWPSAAV